MALFQSFNLVNADLDAQYSKTFTHNKNTTSIQLEWYDENGVLSTTAGVFDIIDANSFSICVGAPITGTHNIKMIYSDNEAIGGTRLFADLPYYSNFLDTSFDTSAYNIAFGNDTGSFNETLENFIKKCKAEQGGGDMLSTNNLSDVSNVSIARGNLGVFSTTEVIQKFLPYTLLDPTFSNIGTWSMKLLSYSFAGAWFNAVNRWGTIDMSFVVTPEQSIIKEGEWVTLFKTQAELVPYSTHVFSGMTNTGEKCICRLLGTTFYNESTGLVENTAVADKGKMQVWMITQVEKEYYFNLFYHVGNYNG